MASYFSLHYHRRIKQHGHENRKNDHPRGMQNKSSTEEEEDEEEEEEPLLIYTAQGSPFRCKKLSVINGSPEHNDVLKLWNTYALH